LCQLWRWRLFGRLKKLTSSTSIAMEKSCEEADFSYVAIA
jgi:hypothetical protein